MTFLLLAGTTFAGMLVLVGVFTYIRLPKAQGGGKVQLTMPGVSAPLEVDSRHPGIILIVLGLAAFGAAAFTHDVDMEDTSHWLTFIVAIVVAAIGAAIVWRWSDAPHAEASVGIIKISGGAGLVISGLSLLVFMFMVSVLPQGILVDITDDVTTDVCMSREHIDLQLNGDRRAIDATLSNGTQEVEIWVPRAATYEFRAEAVAYTPSGQHKAENIGSIRISAPPDGDYRVQYRVVSSRQCGSSPRPYIVEVCQVGRCPETAG